MKQDHWPASQKPDSTAEHHNQTNPFRSRAYADYIKYRSSKPFLIITIAKPGPSPHKEERGADTLHNSRFPLRLGLAVALAFLIAGCSAASSSSAASSPPSAPVTAPSATPSATALSGSRLAGILLPASSMPNGYKLNLSATRNSGSQLPSDTAQPVPASQVCRVFAQTAYIRAAGINTGDFAQSDYLNADHSQEIAEEIDIFTGTDAQKAMTTLWQEFGKCSSFSYPSNGTTASSTLTRSRLPGEGDDAMKAVIVSPVFDGGETLVAIRMGSQIITTADSSSGKDLGSPAVGYAEQIAQRLRAAE
jgi:hypothetical protein